MHAALLKGPMLLQQLMIAPQARYFGHPEACEFFNEALAHNEAHTIVLDLSCAIDATTSAFARLVLLRRELRRGGRDLRITGLHDRAAQLFDAEHLDKVLPRS